MYPNTPKEIQDLMWAGKTEELREEVFLANVAVDVIHLLTAKQGTMVVVNQIYHLDVIAKTLNGLTKLS